VSHYLGSQRDVSETIEKDAALEASERKYRLLFEGNPLPMWVFDVETGAYLAVNDAAVQHYGFTRDEFRRMTIYDVRPIEDVPALRRKLARVAASPGGLDLAGIWRHRKKDGKFVEMDVTTHAVTFGGRAARLATAYDVAAGRHAAEALEASEARFHALLDNTAAVVFLKDQDGRYQLINRQFERLYDLTQADVIGQTDYDLFPRDVADALRRNDRTVLETQRAIEVEEHAPHDGEMRTYLSLKFPLIDTGGKPYAVCGVSTDITARIRTEEALRWSRERLELAQHAGEIGTFEWNLQDGSVAWSPELEALYGMPPGGFGGRYDNWVETLHPDDREMAEDAVQHAATSGTDLDIEFRILWPDQSTHWMAARGRVYFDHEGKPLRLVGINMDVTEQRASDEAAMRLAAIVETSDDAIISSSLDGTFVSWNSGAERLYGYTAAEAIGQSAALIVPPTARRK
jgi:PAS domain S-box-containing protein